MEKVALVIFTALISLAISASPVPPEKAEALAAGFFGTGTKGQSLELVWEGPADFRFKDGSAPYYVYNNPAGGFVIISGDDSVNPVLAYSHHGSFTAENMPSHVKFWMDATAEAVCGSSGPALSSWSAPVSAQPEVYYETALWDQGDYYNDYCPSFNRSTHTLTGCVATAMGIVMRYHKWPEKGTGTTAAYTYRDGSTTRSVETLTLGNIYNWDKMPLSSLTATSSAEEKFQVARLLADLGHSVRAAYGFQGTSAYDNAIAPALHKYFSYDAGMEYVSKFLYTDTEWYNILKNALSTNGPVLYSGSDKDGGHMFVISGYDTQDRFYVNWGWGGRDNGYFSFLHFKDFVADNSIIWNFRKEEGGQSSTDICIDRLTTTARSFTPGAEITLTAEELINVGPWVFEGEVSPAVFSADGSIAVIGEGYTLKLESWYQYPTVTFNHCTLPSVILPGDKIGLLYRENFWPADKWAAVPFNLDSGGAMIPIDGSSSLGKVSSIKYDVATSTLEVVSAKNVFCSLVNATSRTLVTGTGGFSYKVSPGTYTLKLENESTVLTLELKF